MTNALLLLASFLSSPAGAVITGHGTIVSWNASTKECMVLPVIKTQPGLPTLPPQPKLCKVAPLFVESAKLAVGVGVQYNQVDMSFTDYMGVITALYPADDKPVPAPAPKPAPTPTPAPAPAALKATVKSYDAATRIGVMSPANGGRDLVFSVDPKLTAPKVGSKVSYVEAFVTAVEP
jgi:hypothetical protein